MVHKMPVDDKTVKLEIWDTAGQERFVCFFLSFQTHLFFFFVRFFMMIGVLVVFKNRGLWHRCTTRVLQLL